MEERREHRAQSSELRALELRATRHTPLCGWGLVVSDG